MAESRRRSRSRCRSVTRSGSTGYCSALEHGLCTGPGPGAAWKFSGLADEPGRLEVVQDRAGVVLDRDPDGGQPDLGTHRRLVGIVHAGEALQLAALGLGIEALRVPRLAHLDRRVHEDLDEAVGTDQRPALVPGRRVRTHGRADSHAAVANDLGGDEADPPDVGVPVLAAEPEALRQVRADA